MYEVICIVADRGDDRLPTHLFATRGFKVDSQNLNSCQIL